MSKAAKGKAGSKVKADKKAGKKDDKKAGKTEKKLKTAAAGAAAEQANTAERSTQKANKKADKTAEKTAEKTKASDAKNTGKKASKQNKSKKNKRDKRGKGRPEAIPHDGGRELTEDSITDLLTSVADTETVIAEGAAAEDRARAEGRDISPAAESIVSAAVVAAEKFVETPEEAPPVKGGVSAAELASLLRVGEGFTLADVDPASTPGFQGTKKHAVAGLAEAGTEIAEWQERLYAQGKAGGKQSLLLVVQGMDTSGKGGVMRHVVGAMDPQGVKLTSFKAPTDEERSKGYLWRIRNALPGPGEVGVFDRSQYEDVLIVRVHNLVPRSSWGRRYAGINTFERQTAAKGVKIVKVMLHISAEEQKRRLQERIERPDKYWKFNPGDITERQYWDEYMAAYSDAVTKCSTDEAPWYVVPADHKWYAHWAVQQLLLNALRDLDPQWPPADFDIAEQAARLAAT